MKLTRSLIALLLLCGAVALTANAQTLTFGRRTYTGAVSYTHADLNNDGREDLVYPTVVATGPSNGFSVVLSNGNGTYAAPVFYASPDTFPQNIALLDINNDGYIDLITWNSGSHFYEYLNNKNGSFHLQATYELGASITGLVTGDFNHDGYIDVAYLSGNQIHVYFNNHALGFSVGPVTTVPHSGQMEVGDFDGDGKADIFIQGSTICYGDNAGHFTAQVNASTAHQPYLFPMDIDGDGRTDLVGAAATFDPSTQRNFYYKSLFVIYGTSSRTVTESAVPLNGYVVPTVTGSGFNLPVADQADFNGDGKADLVLVEAALVNGDGNRSLAVLTGKGGRVFNPEDVLYSNSQLDLSAQAIRANSDNKPDILADTFANNQATALFLLNDTSAWFGGCSLPTTAIGIHVCSPTTYTSTSAPFSISAAGIPLMHRIELWVDGVKKYQQFARDFSHYAFLDHTVTLSTGTHHVTVYAAGEDNSLQRKDYTITVQ